MKNKIFLTICAFAFLCITSLSWAKDINVSSKSNSKDQDHTFVYERLYSYDNQLLELTPSGSFSLQIGSKSFNGTYILKQSRYENEIIFTTNVGEEVGATYTTKKDINGLQRVVSVNILDNIYTQKIVLPRSSTQQEEEDNRGVIRRRNPQSYNQGPRSRR